MTLQGHTQENRFFLVGFHRTEQLTIMQVLVEDYGQSSFIKRFHNNRPNSFEVGKQVENGEKEEQNERQPESESTEPAQSVHYLVHISKHGLET